MREPTRSESFFLGAGNAISLCGIVWFVFSAPRSLGLLPGMGQWCALMSVLALFVFCTGVRFAVAAQKQKWSPQQCQWRPTLFIGVPLAFCAIKHSMMWVTAPLLISVGILVGILCRRFVYPDLRAEESFQEGQELHVFRK
jgi:hypothetical protein